MGVGQNASSRYHRPGSQPVWSRPHGGSNDPFTGSPKTIGKHRYLFTLSFIAMEKS